jgi:membrane protease YdiL (CAAX protease family)
MIRRVVGSIFFVLIFNGVALSTVILLPPALGLLWVLFLGGGFFWWQFRRDPLWPDRQDCLRLRSPRVPLRPILLSCGASLLLLLGLAGLIELYAPPSAMEDLGFWEQLLRYQSTGLGWIAITLLTVGLIPVVEEFFFRGRIQHVLRQRYSPLLTIVITSCLFMLLHVGVPHWSILLISFILGLTAGVVVFLFDSIWPAVIIHVAWNGLMSLLTEIHSDPTTVFGPTHAEVHLPLATLLIILGCAGWYRLLRHANAGLSHQLKYAAATGSSKL